MVAHNRDMTNHSSDISSPGYIESRASSVKKSKEKLRIDSLIPSEILDSSAYVSTKQVGIKLLLEAYYDFMNMDEFIYAENETFSDIILDGKAVFRISDPKNTNSEFFTDEQGADSTFSVTNVAGDITIVAINNINISISNGNELPGSLAKETSEIGKTFQVQGLAAYNGSTAKLITPIKHWVGPGPSHVLNNIEQAMDIDNNSDLFLELMQKEIASVIPRDITVNKRTLYKSIIEYYKVRGTSDSIEIFFRLLFNDEVEVKYPWDKTLIPSSGNWDVNAALPKGGQYLDNKGFLSDTIKVQDSLRYQKFSYLIRTGQNLTSWENVFNRLVHPAGFKFFGEILMIIELTKAVLGEDVAEGDTLYRKVLSSLPYRQPGTIGVEDLPLLVEMFASVFLPSVEAQIHQSGLLSITLSAAGAITAVEIKDTGWGYSTAPTVVVNGDPKTGQSITTATLTTTIDSNGRIDSVTIAGAGLNYANAYAVVTANSNVGKVHSLIIGPQYYKDYNSSPTINIAPPTATDYDGNLLASNVQATATFTITDGQISGYALTNAGFGYSSNPRLLVGSTAANEIRAKTLEPILILLLNHKADSSRSNIENNYFNRKGDTYLNSSKLYDYNETLEALGSTTLQTTNTTDINNYNVNSFIHLG